MSPGDEHTLSEEQLKNLCRLGEGEKTCSFLVMRKDFVCGKTMPDVQAMIEVRRAEGTMAAQGDNCSGPPDFTPTPEAQ